MQLQTNPYLIWQLLPGLSLLWIALYILSRPIKQRESDSFALLMLGGSLWALANAIQLLLPDINWQIFWLTITYHGIMIVPTAWFLLSIKITGMFRDRIQKYENYFWIPPLVLYVVLLTNTWHHLFFTSFTLSTDGGYVALKSNYGALFYAHTVYSYLALIIGLMILSISLVTKFKKYGIQAYGLLLGILAPLIGNAYFLFGLHPPGFPDPTPMIFTVTGITFGWAIFGGHLLKVVPLAHEAVVSKLSAGIIVLDQSKHIRDINDAAQMMLGVSTRALSGRSLVELLPENPELVQLLDQALDKSVNESQAAEMIFPLNERIFDVKISFIADHTQNSVGWLFQLTDISEKQQVQKTLIATQKTLKAILDTLQDSFFEADRAGVITYANRAFIRNIGFSRWEDVQGKNFRKFADPKSVRIIFEKFNQVYETKQPLEPFTYYYRTRDGSSYIGETTVSPILDGDQVVGTRGLIRDVTARVQAEQEILRQKDMLDGLLQQSPIAMVITDKNSQITLVNPAFEQLFGFSSEDSIGKCLDDLLISPEGVVRHADRIEQAEAYIGKRKSKNGTIFDVEIFTTPFHIGGEQFGYLVFYNNITERLKVQADLEKSQSSYFAVLETLQDPYFEVLPSGQLAYVNQALCEFNGYSRDELIGKHFRIVSSRKSVRETIQKHAEMFRTGKPIAPFEFIYRRKDGLEFPSEMVVSPILDNGVPVGARGIIRDISARVQAEIVLREAKEAAELHARELSLLNRLAATVNQSLDLNDILQAVCRELTFVFDVRNAGISFPTADNKSLKITAFHSIDPEEKSALGLLLPLEGNSSSADALREKKTILIQDAQNDSRTSSVAELYRTRGTKSIMIVPLLVRGEAIGTIGLPARDPDHIFSDGEVQLAETIASQIATAIDNARLYSQTEQALDVAERDLEIGRQIQAGFFPEALPHIPGWEIATHFHAARQVAGDFYDIFQFKNSEFVAFVIADVCDKGVGAALFMVLFRSLLRAFSERTVSSENVSEHLLDIITKTNNFIAEYHGKSNMFATLFFGILDPMAATLYYVNGGHEAPVILGKDGKVSQRLMPTGPAVGMFVDMEFRVESVRFNEGDFVVGFTDGTTDAKNTQGEQFTEERFLHEISSSWTSVFSMLFELNVALKRHMGEQNQFDDITLIALRRKVASERNFHAICRRSELAVLGELRDFVEAAAVHSGLDADDTFAFKLVVDELCANIIQYGYEGRDPGLLSLSFDAGDDSCRLVIRDDGTFFAPEQADTPDIEAGWEERQIGGLGIYFVQELMDDVAYNRVDDKFNQFILEKKRSNPKKH